MGKTYEMLQQARARKKDGYDVVAGVVETHGRRETEALLEGLETVPRRRIEYKGQKLEEMDLDAIIARRPQIVLVDELAHSNVEGSRHPKRYLDVEELMNHGIDVYTTVNIQHIESLNDVVAQITHVRVRETVPDAVFDRADAIELVDLTPDDLIQRLKEGKVYVPKQAERALEHFFSPANLTALRELALRRTADRVDEQLLTEMQAHAIQGPWPAGERILVCISEDPRAAGLVRYAKRLADRLHGPWMALYVEGRRSAQLSEEQRDRIADTLRLAEALGGEAVTLPASDRPIAEDVIGYAQANNATLIVIGKSSRTRWFEILHGSVVHDLVRRSGNISVHVIAGETIAGQPIPKKSVRAAERDDVVNPRPYIAALVAVALALATAAAINSFLGAENVDLVFLTAIVVVAVRLGLWPSLLASVASSLCYNFFFLPPIYTFTITDPVNIAAFLFFTLVAIMVSNVAARGRTLATAAMERARTTDSLHSFSRKLASAGTLDDVLWATAYQTALMLKVRVVLLLPEGGSIAVKAGYPPEDILDDADLAAANWAWQNDRAAGRGSDTLPGAKRLFLPMHTGRGAIGVMGIDSDKPGPLLTPDQRRLLDALRRPGRARHRARAPGRGDGSRRARRRNRTAALGAPDLDFARPEDAACLGAGRGGNAARSRRAAGRCTKGRSSDDDHRRIRAAQPLHRQPARHDQARIRRHQPERGACTISARSSAAPCVARAASLRAIASSSTSPRICRCSSSTPFCSSRRCSTSSTMPPNTRRRRPRYASRAGAAATPSACASSMKAAAFPPAISSTSSTSSTGRRRPTRCAPARGLALRSRAASSKRCTAPSSRRTAPTAPARPSPSACRSRASANAWTPPHERRPAPRPGGR